LSILTMFSQGGGGGEGEED